MSLINVSNLFQLQACDEGASALLIHHRNASYLFDCWLGEHYDVLNDSFYLGQRINSAWVKTENLPPLHGLFLSSRHNDHSHPQTLRQIQKRYPLLPVWAPKGVRRKLNQLGFNNLSITTVGGELTIGQHLKIIQLKGYGGAAPYIFQDICSGYTICLAPHSINLSWLLANHDKLREQLKINKQQSLVSTLCWGVTPTLLNPWHRFYYLMPDKGVNIPLPDKSLHILKILQPQKIISIHKTPEFRCGWATKNLVQFPWAPKQEAQLPQIDTGSTITEEWLKQHYKEGQFINPQLGLIHCGEQ